MCTSLAHYHEYMIVNTDISFVVLFSFSDMEQLNSSSMLVLREEQHHKIDRKVLHDFLAYSCELSEMIITLLFL